MRSEQEPTDEKEIKYSNFNLEEDTLTKKDEESRAKDFYDNPFNSPNHISCTTENESLPINEWKNPE